MFAKNIHFQKEIYFEKSCLEYFLFLTRELFSLQVRRYIIIIFAELLYSRFTELRIRPKL